MCRLYGLLANEPTKVECSLVRAQNLILEQSRSAANGALADGWGVVCYDEQQRWPIPTTVRHSHATSVDAHFNRGSENVYSYATVAHVRLATVGHVSPLNAHPFTHDEWTFAHNGTIPSFETTVGRSLESCVGERYMNCRLGNTDSELFFLWLLSQFEDHGLTSQTIPQRHHDAMGLLSEAISELSGRCHQASSDGVARLNFVLTNGQLMFACRWNNPLYQLLRTGLHDCEICDVPHVRHIPDVQYRAVVFASEPITGETWTQLPDHSLSYVSPELACESKPIEHNNTEKVST